MKPLLIKFFQAIDRSFVGRLVDRKLAVLDTMETDRIYVENVRSFYNISLSAAKFFCELAVKQKVFNKKYGIVCRNESCKRTILSISNKSQLPPIIVCEHCQLLEKENYQFSPTEKDLRVFYQLAE